MKNQIIADFEKKTAVSTKKHPEFRPGDRIKVHYKIQEGNSGKFRIQAFEGVCIRFKKGTVDASFTVRKMGANNIGVERVFALENPRVDKIDLIAGGIVRRSRLFYLRERSGKSARIKTRRFKQGEQTVSIDKTTEA